ncbi:RBR-type E3 ubiquitin transferase [Mycena sanguinolenta]|uniref:RBR-type E3 ubiquitin transferase n=1 Tax=Mycena sanguinolenta TaxID=230812 RepID=A0A8H7D576_9AGAR|nr:RBR-type E3 ubiquitin transferase [Mycena sanguinolenta]
MSGAAGASSRICRDFLRGQCTRGDNCRFIHQTENDASLLLPRSTAQRASRRRDRTLAHPDTPGPSSAVLIRLIDLLPHLKHVYVPKEAKNHVMHGEMDTVLKAQNAGTRMILRFKKLNEYGENMQQELRKSAPVKARQIELDARNAEIRRKEAAQTIQHIVLGTTLVTYSAGISIQEIVTGFEACRIQISNLPLDATHDEIKALFTQQGVDETRIFITGTKELPDRRLEATLITSSEEGGAIAAGLEDIEFRRERLHFEVSEHSRSGGMGNSASKASDTLTLSWRAPSSAVVVTFNTIDEAAAKVRELDRKICAGRRVRVEMNQPPPGYARGMNWQSAVKITGLPSGISPHTVTEFTGSYLLKFLKPISYDVDSGLRILRQNMERVAGGGGELKSFDAVTQNDIDGNIAVKARFDSWETAKQVQDSLAGRQQYLGACSLRMWLPHPLQYIISIPLRQYQAQKSAWDSLADSDGTSNKTAYLRIFPTQNAQMHIKVLGEDKKAVGSLKVRVESLVGGEQLGISCWHRSLKTAAGTQFLNSVFNNTGAYARADWKLGVVKVYGDSASIDKARDFVQAEVDRLGSMEWSVFLKKESMRFFIQRGIATLKEALGDDNANLVISPRASKVVIRGGEDARHLLTRLIDESLAEGAGNIQRTMTGAPCPICYDEVSHPVTLGCNHAYCIGCIRHYLSTAADTFPLVCLGNEATCETPIPLSTIKQFLPLLQFHQLLDTAFLRHIERHPQEFKYCKTPDCTQIYRCSAAATAVTCPSCFLAICSSCHQDGHDGVSCAEKRLQSDPEEQERRNDEWARANGVKRCP